MKRTETQESMTESELYKWMYFRTFFSCGLREIPRAQNEPGEKNPKPNALGAFYSQPRDYQDFTEYTDHFQLAGLSVFVPVWVDGSVSVHLFVVVHLPSFPFQP